jgi:stress-induced-phosphoprotein 1
MRILRKHANVDSQQAGSCRFEGALEDAERCIALNPAYAVGVVRKGQALAMLGRLDLAVETLEKALAKDPTNDVLVAALKVTCGTRVASVFVSLCVERV